MKFIGSLWLCAMLAAPFPVAGDPIPLVGVADVLAVEDGARVGIVTFEPDGDGMITISGELWGLGESTKHAFYIHEYGNCADNGTKVGGHFNPTGAKHGPPSSPKRHAGDFGSLTTDAEGNASFSMRTNSITIEPGGNASVVDLALVIHVLPDSRKGDAGDALACGVIHLMRAS